MALLDWWVPLALAGGHSHPHFPTGRVSGEEWAPVSAALRAPGFAEGGVESAPSPIYHSISRGIFFLFPVLIVRTSCCCHPPWLG